MADFGSFLSAGAEVLLELVKDANNKADLLISAGNSQSLLHEIRDDVETEDTEILKFRAWFDAANNEILAMQKKIESYIVENGMVDTTPVDVEATTAAYKAVAGQARDMRKTLASMPGAEEVLKDIPDVKSAPGTGRGGASTTGIPRPRFTSIKYRVAGSDTYIDVFVEKDGKTPTDPKVRVSNLTVLSQLLVKNHKGVSISAKDLQSPMFDAAGTTDLSTLSGKTVDFIFAVAGNTPATYQIEVVPS